MIKRNNNYVCRLSNYCQEFLRGLKLSQSYAAMTHPSKKNTHKIFSKIGSLQGLNQCNMYEAHQDNLRISILDIPSKNFIYKNMARSLSRVLLLLLKQVREGRLRHPVLAATGTMSHPMGPFFGEPLSLLQPLHNNPEKQIKRVQAKGQKLSSA